MAWPWKVQKGAATQAQEGKGWKQNLFNSGGLKISPIDLETVTNGTDSYIMHTWYVGQAQLFLLSRYLI